MICESLIDNAKSRGITVLCTSLLDHVRGDQELSASNVSTIADTWIHVSYLAHEGERNRALTIIKSRGTDHSNQVRELILSRSGVDLSDVYVVEGQVLMGSARAQKEDETRRRKVLNEIAFKRLGMERAQEVAELKARILVSTQELGWKQQEAIVRDALEGTRIEREEDASSIRLSLRRAGADEAPKAVPIRRGGESAMTTDALSDGTGQGIGDDTEVKLRLYVARTTPNSARAEHHLKSVLARTRRWRSRARILRSLTFSPIHGGRHGTG